MKARCLMSISRTAGFALAAAVAASSNALAVDYSNTIYAPWTYSAGCVAWRASEANFHQSTIAYIDSQAALSTNALGTAGNPWQAFARTLNGGSNSDYAAPGLALVYDEEGHTANSAASFSPLSLGGLWVSSYASAATADTDAVPYSIGGTSANERVTELGADGYGTLFRIDKSFSIERSSQTRILGSVSVEVAVLQRFQMSASGVQTVVAEDATLKLSGLGTVCAGGGLVVNGTLDITSAGDEAISGPVVINSTATIKIPAGVQFTATSSDPVRISDTPITAAPTANVEHNGTLYSDARIDANWDGANATITIVPTTRYTATLVGDTDFANIPWDNNLAPGSMDTAVIALSGAGTVTGLTVPPLRLELDNGVVFDMSQITNLSGTELVGTGTFLWRAGYPEDVPAGLVYEFQGSSTLPAAVISDLSVAGTLKASGFISFQRYASVGTASVLDVNGTVSLDCEEQMLHGTINVNSGATLENLCVADAIDYTTYQTEVNVLGALNMAATRWTMRLATLNVYSGANINGSGQGDNGALDFIDNGAIHAFDDASIDAAMRFRNTLTPVTVESGKTLTMSGATMQGYSGGGIEKLGAGTLKFTANPDHLPAGIKVAAGTLAFDTPADVTTTVIYPSQPSGGNYGYLTQPNWKGTLVIGAVEATTTLQMPLQNYGTESSSIKLEGLSTSGGGSTWLGAGDIEVKPALVLAGDVKFSNGSSGQTVTFRKIAGGSSCLELYAWSTCTGITYALGEIDSNGFSGTVMLSGRNSVLTLRVGNVVRTDVNPGMRVLSIDKQAEATVDISGATLNGVPGLLELREDGVYIKDSANSISGVGTAVVSAPADANPDDVCAMVNIVPPTPEAEAAVEDAQADYRSYFRLTATYDAGTATWTVTAELNLDVVLPGGPAMLDALQSGSDMTFQICPGLYYSVGVARSLGDLRRPAGAVATSTTLTAQKPEGATSAFFRIYVSALPFAGE